MRILPGCMCAEHSRRSYVAGCRCVACRAANAAYVRARRQADPATVDAAAARAHLAQLAALGAGSRHLASQTGIARRTVLAVLAGRLTTIRTTTAAALMAARPTLAHGARVASTKTWRTIDSLRREGFTHRQIAFYLGAQSQQLQLSRATIRARSALRVAQLYQHLAA